MICALAISMSKSTMLKKQLSPLKIRLILRHWPFTFVNGFWLDFELCGRFPITVSRVRREGFYERFNAVQEAFQSLHWDRNGKFGENDLGDHNGNGEWFAVFCSFDCLAIRCTLVEYRAWHKASWVSTDRPRTPTQMGHIMVISIFRSCLIGCWHQLRAKPSIDNRLPSLASASFHRSGELLPMKLNLVPLWDSAVFRQWRNCLHIQFEQLAGGY